MTLIECFDRECLHNVLGGLGLQPEKAIFLGDGEAMEGMLSRLRRLLQSRGIKTALMPYHVRMDRIDDITMVLRNILRREDDYVIDITGGSEELILAVGLVLGQMDKDRRSRIEVQKFDPVTGKIMDADGNGKIFGGSAVCLSVDEVIALHGGTIHPESHQPGLHYRPGDVLPLWNAMCADRKEWNKAVMALNEFEARCDSDNEIYLRLEDLNGSVNQFRQKEDRMWWLLEKLSHCGVIDDRSSGEVFHYRYLDPLLHSCAQKAGNLLEIMVLLQARACKLDGESYFDDCQMSVSIDWDGVVHQPVQQISDTCNEIDVIATRGQVSLFISCKNGEIGEEELYKLNTVAGRFGGKYARKMLVATDLERKSPSSIRAFLQRAKDMNIHVVQDAAQLNKAGWQQIFIDAMNLK